MKMLKIFVKYIFLILISIFFVYPLYYVFCKASGGNTDYNVGMPFPGAELWRNISHILFKTKFMDSFLYTLKYTFVQTVLTLCICSLAGYGLELYHDKWKDRFFKIILWTFLIPFATFVVPLFVTFSALHMVNTTTAMIIPFIASPLIIMIFRQQSRSFSKEVMEAARMDGLREPFIFLRIYVPNMKATFACGGIVTFLNAWNSYLWPSIIMLNREKIPMTTYLELGQKGDVMTLVLLSMIPTLVVFFSLQKFFVKGMEGIFQ